MTTTEQELAALARDFPGWSAWSGVAGWYARRPLSSPPRTVGPCVSLATLRRALELATGKGSQAGH